MFFNPDIFNSETRTETETYKFDLDVDNDKANADDDASVLPRKTAIELTIECMHEENQFVEAFVSRVVWPSAKALADYFCSHERRCLVERKRILELGSGTGLCGILLAKIGAEQVVMTDGCMNAVDVIQRNVERNNVGSVARAEQLTWGEQSPSLPSYEVCIGTDVIYEPDAVYPLLATVVSVLEPEGVFYLANHTHRFAGLESVVLAAAEATGLELVKSCSIDEGIDLRVFQARKKKQVPQSEVHTEDSEQPNA